MEDTYTCQLCQSNRFEKSLHVDDVIFSSNIKSFDIVECKECGLSSMYPMAPKEDIEEIYVDDNVFSNAMVNPYQNKLMFNMLNPLFTKYGNSRRYAARKSLQLLDKKKDISVLDIGCSTGDLLKEFKMKDSTIDMFGIDIDPQAYDNAPDDLKDHITIGEFLDHNFTKTFDIVCMCYVIEHIVELRQYLEKAVKLLNPGGILFISTPDISSPKAQQKKDRWNLISDKRQKIGHIRWFNRQSIDYIAKDFGLKLKHCNNVGELLYHLPVKTQNRLKKVFGVDHTGERFIKYYTPRIIYALFADSLFSQMFSYGDCILAFYTKDKN